MKRGPVAKLNKKNTKTSRNFDDDVILVSHDFIVIFPIYDRFEAIREPDAWF